MGTARFWRQASWGGVWIAIVCTTLFFVAQRIAHSYWVQAQAFDLNLLEALPEASRIEDRDGTVYGEAFLEDRERVSLSDVPLSVQGAILSAEDRRFFQHPAFDILGIARAVLANVRRNQYSQGASTLTQQLVRLRFGLRGRTLNRKLLEIFLATRVEKAFSKNRIFELYLNTVYFGDGYYGVAAAARGFFGKTPAELTPNEAALLAVLIRSPIRLAPRSNPGRASRLRDAVLRQMTRDGYIHSYQDWVSRPVIVLPRSNLERDVHSYSASLARHEAVTLLGEHAVVGGGYTIRTTVDSRLDTVLQTTLSKLCDSIEIQHPSRDDDPLQCAGILIDSRSNDILAVCGGRDFERSPFNRALFGRIAIGSGFTPFLITAAIEVGFFPGIAVADSPLDNRRIEIGGTGGILGEWATETADNSYQGNMAAYKAILLGKMSACARFGYRIGIAPIITTAASLGFHGSLPAAPAVFLGEEPVSLFDTACAYGAIATGIKNLRGPALLTEIDDNAGHIIYQHPRTRTEFCDLKAAWCTNHLLQANTVRLSSSVQGLDDLRRIAPDCGVKTGIA